MRREGRAIRIRITAGRMVQIISISWESRIYLLVRLVEIIATII